MCIQIPRKRQRQMKHQEKIHGNLFQLIDRQLVANCCQFQKPEKRLPQDQKYFSFSAHHCFLRKRYLKKKAKQKSSFYMSASHPPLQLLLEGTILLTQTVFICEDIQSMKKYNRTVRRSQQYASCRRILIFINNNIMNQYY